MFLLAGVMSSWHKLEGVKLLNSWIFTTSSVIWTISLLYPNTIQSSEDKAVWITEY